MRRLRMIEVGGLQHARRSIARDSCIAVIPAAEQGAYGIVLLRLTRR